MSTRVAIYLDSNAGAPLKPAALEALSPFLLEKGFLPNPSSIHSHGRIAKRAFADAREKVAQALGPQTDPEQIVFTSSGSEANQLAIRSILEPLLNQGKKPHWVTTLVEHDSCRQLATWLEARGGTVSYLPLDSFGNLEVSKLSEYVRPETALVSAIWVNNETGIVTGVAELARLTRLKAIPLHLDAAQAWGKLPIDVATLGAQLVTVSGHKIGALAGVGALWVARGIQIEAVLPGKQEKGRRGGTENILGILSLGGAASCIDPLGWSKRVQPVRDRLQAAILDQIPGTLVNGENAVRVANTLNLNFNSVEGDGLVMALDLAGYSVSSGSACSSGVLEPSHVLMALGRNRNQAMAAIRISLVDEMPWEVLQGFVNALEGIVSRVRKAAEQRGKFSNPRLSL